MTPIPGVSVEIIRIFQVWNASLDPTLALFKVGFGCSADPLDHDGERAGAADTIQDFTDAPEINTADVADGREIPVLNAQRLSLRWAL